MHLHFIEKPDMENLIVDSSVVRAHACAAGALKKTVAKLSKPWVEVEAASPPKSM